MLDIPRDVAVFARPRWWEVRNNSSQIVLVEGFIVAESERISLNRVYDGLPYLLRVEKSAHASPNGNCSWDWRLNIVQPVTTFVVIDC